MSQPLPAQNSDPKIMPKRDLVLSPPRMNAAGTLGYVPDLRSPIPWVEFGAFITNPVSMRRRSAAEHPTLLEYPGGLLLHSGLPNPGFRTILEKYARRWKESRLPIIVHLMADRPEETRDMVRALEGLENIAAVELGFAPLLADDIILLACEMSRGELPLIVCLPPEVVLRLGPSVLSQGAAAISFAAPRGTLSSKGKIVAGRLFGPSLFPQTLDIVSTAARVGIPTIAGGGVYSSDDANAMLAAGAIAVQFDAQLWLP